MQTARASPLVALGLAQTEVLGTAAVNPSQVDSNLGCYAGAPSWGAGEEQVGTFLVLIQTLSHYCLLGKFIQGKSNRTFKH